MIEANNLKQLVQLMVDNDLTELDLHDEKQQVTIKRASKTMAPVMHAAPQYAMPVQAPAAAPAAAAPAAAAPAAGAASDAGLIAIESPMVGTFYSAANPDSPPFVTAGASVTPSSVVCLIEAMKVFNEIKAEKAGKIERVLVKSGEAVEFGQKLFLVRP
mgnify:CR=1 FL=1